MRWLACAFLVGHGWVHGVMWALPYSEEARADLPMDPAHSWLLGDARAVGFDLALLSAAGFVVTAIAFIAGAVWWPAAALISAGLSALLLVVFFSPWWLIGLALDGAVVIAAWRAR